MLWPRASEQRLSQKKVDMAGEFVLNLVVVSTQSHAFKNPVQVQ
jgi:hypothetical protein